MVARRNRTRSSVFTDTGELDVAVCERARVARDRRYDDLFFFGVRTTGVYCGPYDQPDEERDVLSVSGCSRAGRISPRPQMPARDAAVLGSVESFADNSGAGQP